MASDAITFITLMCGARRPCRIRSHAGSMERLSFGGLAMRGVGAPVLPAGLRCRARTVSCAWRKGGSEGPIACGDGKLPSTICAQENSMRVYPSPWNVPLRRLRIILMVSVVRMISASGFEGFGSTVTLFMHFTSSGKVGVAADVMRIRMVICIVQQTYLTYPLFCVL